VSLGVAKDQRLSLNPTQISGACGRLMCSLRYEHEFYVQARRRFPKEGKTLRTAAGEERVVSNDIFRERVVLRNAEGEMRTVPLAQLLEEAEAAGSTIVPALSSRDSATSPAPANLPRRERRPAEPTEEQAEEDADDEDASPEAGANLPSAENRAESPTAERRPHRRRGRRGGRRNRGRRDGGSPGTEGGGGDDGGNPGASPA
jgi:hypothetical protein